MNDSESALYAWRARERDNAAVQPRAERSEDRRLEPLVGPDAIADLKTWLEDAGFRTSPDRFGSQSNDCRWYAYRASALSARECECNDGKPAQIVVKPYATRVDGVWHESVEVEVCGEAGGVWWKLMAYSVSLATLKASLPEIETSLIAAWNALRPNAQVKGTPGAFQGVPLEPLVGRQED